MRLSRCAVVEAVVYYHFSYWGIPYDFLWLSTVSPTLTSFEMYKAYTQNCKDIWIFNVGDIKPQESELQFALDMAWDVDQWTPEKAYGYTEEWAPEYFELSQVISGLQAGNYTLTCMMAVSNDMLTTQRLFANDVSQYYGREEDYDKNIDESETYTFAGWSTSSNYFLKPMSVTFNIEENEELTIGIRSSNKFSDGTFAVSGPAGWFKCDDFRLVMNYALADTLAFEEILIGDAGWTSFSSDNALDFGSVEGLKAYFVDAASNSIANLVEITNPDASVGLILNGVPGSYMVQVMKDGETPETNLLVATNKGEVMLQPTGDGNWVYAFGYKESDYSDVGFYTLYENRTIPKYHSYLNAEKDAIGNNGVNFIRINTDELTSIKGIAGVNDKDDVKYDLMGRKVGLPSKGVYIMNGEKMMVR